MVHKSQEGLQFFHLEKQTFLSLQQARLTLKITFRGMFSRVFPLWRNQTHCDWRIYAQSQWWSDDTVYSAESSPRHFKFCFFLSCDNLLISPTFLFVNTLLFHSHLRKLAHPQWSIQLKTKSSSKIYYTIDGF